MAQNWWKTQPRGKRLALAACLLALLLSVVPLYAISFYNHPYYDDFGFSAAVHTVWKETGSLPDVLRTAWESAKAVRNSWQGTYTGTLLSNLQPGVFSESLYFIGAFVLLTAFLACFWFLFATVFGRKGLGLSGVDTAILSSLALALMIQLMPDPGEAFFWFNGGVGNVFIYSLLALAGALLLRLAKTQGAGRAAGLTALLALVMVALGGGSYGGGLFGLCGLGLAVAWLFVRKKPRKWLFTGLWALLLACFCYSMAAPGNGVRAGMIGAHPSPVKAVLQALYYGTAQMGSYLRLPLIGVTLLALPLFLRGVRASACRFDHPWLALGVLGGLFCTQLAPPLYGGVFIGGPRIVNTYWISFVTLWLLYACYVTGFVVKRLERSEKTALPCRGGAARRWLAAAGVCALLVGCLGYKQPEDQLYGVQNLAGVSASLSLLSGEAACYDREMDAREALLNDSSQPEVTLASISATPRVFMDDLLAPGAAEDVRPQICRYYQKTAIALEGEGEAP